MTLILLASDGSIVLSVYWSQAQADRRHPTGLRLAAIDARLDPDLADAAHPHERIANLRRQ